MSTVRDRIGGRIDAAITAEVLAGLRKHPKQLPCKLFYDDAGAELFERICTLPEYYPTRTELSILRDYGREMAEWIGEHARIVEYGSGSGEKTRVLLRLLDGVAEYVPIDISREQLLAFAAQVRKEFPAVQVNPLHADYTKMHALPEPAEAGRTIVFFPGSTIGNFHPADSREFLRNAASQCGHGGGLLIGVDLKKDRGTLERAYNDSQGVTAAFNLNILEHINRTCDADFDVSKFEHRAIYDVEHGRIEMHLISAAHQQVTIGVSSQQAEKIEIGAGEPIVTEYSYKYSPTEFQRLAMSAGYRPARLWQDEQHRFSVMAFDIQ